MEQEFIVRAATATDHTTLYHLIQTAFQTAEHRDGDEQDFAVRLRNGASYIPELELVAEREGQLIGHIMLTRTYVTSPAGDRYFTLLVAPLSTLLEHRGKGVGAALMNEGCRIAQTMGYSTAFLVGDPRYYQRFGYRLAQECGIRHESLPPEYVMAKEFVPGALDGIRGLIAM